MQESQTAQSNTGLIYGLNDRPPVRAVSYTHLTLPTTERV